MDYDRTARERLWGRVPPPPQAGQGLRAAHLGVHGTYSFVLSDLGPGAIRELRDPKNPNEDEDE